jgi:UDP-3-O-[3-hydroxymyristoyl] glucosamine N-acyltransferase
MTIYNFGAGLVPAHRHQNPDGTTGGWVADTATVASTAVVEPNAQVFGNARISGNARVYSNAQLFDDTLISKNARINSVNSLLSGTIGKYSWTAFRDQKT